MTGKVERVFLYRPGKTRALSVPIAEVNSTKDFYSDPKSPSLDQDITKLESDEFGHVLHRVRLGTRLSADDIHSLRRFVAHLVIRTRSTRTFTANLANRTQSGIEASVTNPGIFANFIRNHSDEMAGLVESVADAALAELAARGLRLPPNELAARKAELLRQLTEYPDAVGRELATGAAAALAHAPLPSIVAATIQRSALERNLVPPAGLENLESYDLSIEEVDDDLLLGDDPVLALSVDGMLQRVMLHDEEPALYCLPVTPRLVLALRRPEAPPLPPAVVLNQFSATSSREHFIAGSDRHEFLSLVDQIDSFRSESENIDIAAMLVDQVPRRTQS